MRNIRLYCNIILFTSTLAISGCNHTTPQVQRNQADHIQQAVYYLHEANHMRGSADSGLLLQAAAVLLANAYQDPAAQLLSSITTAKQQNSYWLLMAKASKLKQHQQALQYLQKFKLNQASPQEKLIYYQTKAKLHKTRYEWLASALAMAQLHALNPARDNAIEIMYLLSRLNPQKLTSNKVSTILQPWLELANIQHKLLLQPEALAAAMATDKQRKQLSKAADIDVALILPLSGKLSKAGQAIKHGFMDAIFKLDSKQNYRIKMYDSNLRSMPNILQAIKKSTDFIIGPLTKTNVDSVLAAKLGIPTIILNEPSSSRPLSKMIWKFTLNPAIEAAQVANQAWKIGKRKALIISQDDSWGHKVAAEFMQTWQAHQGEMEHIKVKRQHNIDAQLLSGLEVQKSKQRHQAMTKIIGHSQFYPHINHDIDMVFLACNHELAKQIIPRLKFYYVNNASIFATSAVYKGFPNSTRDQDLNGVIFCEMPKILQKIPLEYQEEWPDSMSSKYRLYNLGYDAFLIMANLSSLQHKDTIGLPLGSGLAYLDKQHVKRRLNWAVFLDGKAHRLTW